MFLKNMTLLAILMIITYEGKALPGEHEKEVADRTPTGITVMIEAPHAEEQQHHGGQVCPKQMLHQALKEQEDLKKQLAIIQQVTAVLEDLKRRVTQNQISSEEFSRKLEAFAPIIALVRALQAEARKDN